MYHVGYSATTIILLAQDVCPSFVLVLYWFCHAIILALYDNSIALLIVLCWFYA